jgi:predicted nicotinamide N-methyase
VTVPPRQDPELTAERLELAGLELDLLRPRDPEALLDEEAFEHEEFLPYWAELWPSAGVLAQALLARPDLRGLEVLELGCGLGTSGLAAAAGGARVTATDWAPDALDLLRRNAERNGLTLAVRRLDWFAPADGPLFDDPGPPPPPGGWPLVVAADVLYEARNRPALLRTLDRVVARDGEAWIADPGRRPAEPFWREAAEGWTVEVLGDRPARGPVVRRLRRRGG